MEVKQVGELRGALLSAFVSEEKDFELYAMCDGEPVQVLEDWGDLVYWNR